MVEHHALFYADLSDPLALLQKAGRPGEHTNAPDQTGQTRLGRYWAYVDLERPANLAGPEVGAYTALMSASQPLVASQILKAYRLAGHRCLLDVGGGDGTFIERAAQRVPNLQFILFDLPAVAERAKRRFATAGLANRANAVGGDFLQDALPRGADIASLVRVIHDHDDQGALAILKAVRRALPPDGVLLLAEPMSGMRGAEAVGDAYFGFYLLAMGRGRPRTGVELVELVRAAGFDSIRLVPTDMPLQTALLTARCGPE
jgi:demethylspheroidene O-methyltransferase